METLGYNKSSNYFKKDEGNKEGMMVKLGLNEIEVEQQIDQRMKEYSEKIHMLGFKYEQDLKDYKRLIESNPKWASKPRKAEDESL